MLLSLRNEGRRALHGGVSAGGWEGEMTVDRSKQPAILQRRIRQLEAHLQAEKDAHAKTFAIYRDTLHELVDLKLRQQEASDALEGER